MDFMQCTLNKLQTLLYLTIHHLQFRLFSRAFLLFLFHLIQKDSQNHITHLIRHYILPRFSYRILYLISQNLHLSLPSTQQFKRFLKFYRNIPIYFQLRSICYCTFLKQFIKHLKILLKIFK